MTAIRAQAPEKAIKMLRQKSANRSVQDALNNRHWPDTSQNFSLPIGSEVRVWRENKGWMGQYKIISINNHNVTVDIPGAHSGPTKFRSTTVQPYFHEDDETNEISENNEDLTKNSSAEENSDYDEYTPPNFGNHAKNKRGRSIGSRNKAKPHNYQAALQDAFLLCEAPNEVMLSTKEENDRNLSLKLRAEGKITANGDQFQASDQLEIDNLIEKGVFEFVKYDELTHVSSYEKSRLVVQGHSDKEKKETLTQSPSIQRASQRLMIAIAPAIKNILRADIYPRDITQAYAVSAMALNRTICAKLPVEISFKYPPNTIMRIIKPLYGIEE
ncbi:hypothetical protein K3495_g11382 [Podosphaera aphanis]|nr:hypothetical protein K3495_g11382 [Podosphaera aphanis]